MVRKVRQYNAVDVLGEIAAVLSPPATTLWIDSPHDPRTALRAAVSRLAVVGTRRPHPHSIALTNHWVQRLAAAGVVILSGLARGIDTVAHHACLAAGGTTVAFLAHGLDRIYPPENARLAAQIVDSGGALLSEFAPGVGPEPYYFPRRNRLIAAAAHAVLIVEAGEKSGTLSTARAAAELGHEVLVVPAIPGDPAFRGSERLLEEGARAVRSVSEVLEFLGKDALLSHSPYLRGEGRTANLAEQEFAALARLFAQKGKVRSLDELFLSSPLTFGELADALDKAAQHGLITEIAPQSYQWVGGP